MPRDFYLTSQVARIFEVSSETIREMERSGRLPAVKTPTGVRMFDPQTVARVKAQREAARRVVADAARAAELACVSGGG